MVYTFYIKMYHDSGSEVNRKYPEILWQETVFNFFCYLRPFRKREFGNPEIISIFKLVKPFFLDFFT